METPSSYGSVAVPPSLNHFAIYNPTFGPTEETQQDQLLYYVAKKTVPVDVKMRQIGLAQGLINFTRAFSPTKACENVHTQKNRMVFHEPEKDYWIYVSIELGHIKKLTKDKDGKPKTVVEYFDSNLHDSGIKRMLEMGYEMYRVFNGTFDSTVKTLGVKALKIKLEEFFSNWVLEWEFDKTELTKTIDGQHYYKNLLKQSYVSSFVEQIQMEYKFISEIIVLWQNKLVYNGDGNRSISENDLKCILRHLDPLISERDALEREHEKKKKSKEADKLSLKGFTRNFSGSNLFSYFSSTISPSTSPPNNMYASNSSNQHDTLHSSSNLTRSTNFLLGPSHLNVDDSDIKPLKVYLTKKVTGHLNDDITETDDEYESNVEEHFLVAYKQNDLTLVFLIPNSLPEGYTKTYDKTFYKSIHEYLSSHSDDIIKIMNEDYEHSIKLGFIDLYASIRSDTDKEYRYVFFNKLNLAIKSSLYPFNASNGTSSSKGLTINGEMAHALYDLHEDLEKYPHLTEIYTRSTTNFWIVGKRSNGRVLYVVVPKKEVSLMEVEAKLQIETIVESYYNEDLSFYEVL
ncbi:15439_t:CDS:10 [Gigaspora margarita]|uniref:15439_t:CDS:1 n=1 Tax=Gigaspora margarita TaxID=4874 RepID=A0ABN7VMZ1_GIGMA|nr:15439_t:CDS:10 [Gigaspora margarita]